MTLSKSELVFEQLLEVNGRKLIRGWTYDLYRVQQSLWVSKLEMRHIEVSFLLAHPTISPNLLLINLKLWADR